MSSNTLYLKWRPFQLSDLVGQSYNSATFKQASISGKFSHAYLFGGVRGCGKTTTARILSNLITCENVKDGVLCGSCVACQKVPYGRTPDVIELDGAKNGKVEDVQALIESASWSPTELKKKVYIIDEAHQLTSRAISALLKIVEEPPEYLTFIFATTEVDKIPDTILSRTQRFMFNKIPLKDTVGRLRFISDKEGFKISDEALFAIAKIGRGSMRESIGCLEQISTAAGSKNIDGDSVYKYFGMVDRKGVFDILKSIVSCDVSLLMDQVNDLVMANVDPKSILYELSELFRSLTVLKVQKGSSKLIDMPDHEIQNLMNIGASIKLSQLDLISKSFSTIDKELDYSINKRWVMESVLIRCAKYLRPQ